MITDKISQLLFQSNQNFEYLIFGLAVLFTVHLLPAIPTLRQQAIQLVGKKIYLGAFTFIALIGLSLIIYGKFTAPHLPIWNPPFWAVFVPVIVMPFVFILILCAYFPTNIGCAVRHPMLIGVLLWSLTHLSINGDLASMILFGGFSIFSILLIALADNRQNFNKVKKISVMRDVTAAASGVVVFVVVLYFHHGLFSSSMFRQ